MSIAEFLKPQDWFNATSGPLYVRLQKRIQQGIDTGLLTPEAPLPAEREIAALTGLSRVTVRKAVGELVEKGAIVQRQGSGSFVVDPAQRVEQSLSRLTSFTEDMARRGMESQSHWLERGLFMPSPQEVLALALGADDSVVRIARLRTADGRPMAIERASLPPDLLPNPTALTHSLYEELGKSGNRPVRALQKISAINLGQPDADLLRVSAGDAGLKIERTSYLPGGRVAEFTRSIYRGDAYEFVAELRLAPRPQGVT